MKDTMIVDGDRSATVSTKAYIANEDVDGLNMAEYTIDRKLAIQLFEALRFLASSDAYYVTFFHWVDFSMFDWEDETTPINLRKKDDDYDLSSDATMLAVDASGLVSPKGYVKFTGIQVTGESVMVWALLDDIVFYNPTYVLINSIN